jgi:hypothetical protein
VRNTSLAAVLLVLALPASAAPRYDGSNHFVSPRLDGTPVIVENAVTGQTWSAWSYANSGELDLALSFRDAGGRWSTPILLGEGDGIDQIDPALLTDARGVVYLAYAERGTGRVRVAALASAASAWRAVATIESAAGAVAAPALKLVGDRLVLAFRAGRDVEIHELPPFLANDTLGIDDGPDPFGNGPTGSGQGNGSQGWKPRR